MVQSAPFGRLRAAPESFLDAPAIAAVTAEARHGRRDFLRVAFATAALGGAARAAQAQSQASGAGDPSILTLPEHSRALGL